MSRKVSVIIPCFNHGEFVREAVGSVLSAKRDDLELIVVDDGSTDEWTRKEMDALSASGIKVIRQENKGLAAARNAGINAAQGGYILPLDADDRMRGGWIERAIEILDSKPQVGVVCGDTEFFGVMTGRWRGGPFELLRLMRENYIPCSALYRRSVWEQNGGYDGTMPVQGFEDWDLWLGAAEHGWEFAYLPEVFFDYRKASESMLTHARVSESAVAVYVVRKHASLYREGLLSLLEKCDLLRAQRESLRWTVRNLGRLLKSRLGRRFGKKAENVAVVEDE